MDIFEEKIYTKQVLTLMNTIDITAKERCLVALSVLKHYLEDIDKEAVKSTEISFKDKIERLKEKNNKHLRKIDRLQKKNK